MTWCSFVLSFSARVEPLCTDHSSHTMPVSFSSGIAKLATKTSTASPHSPALARSTMPPNTV